MECTYSNGSPWTDVSLAVVKQSGIAKLASPRKNRTQSRNWGSLQREYHRMSRPKWKEKAERVAEQAAALKQANVHTEGIQGQTLLSPAADPLSSDARSPSQLRQMCSGGMREAGTPTSKQRGRVRRSTENVVRAWVARGRRMSVVEPGYRDAGWMPEGTIEGCGGGEVGCRRPEAE